ncbi:TPM domain-containing protein [Clostridium sp. MD294]|uniref:TPM domain-containing protein n=1 Tax=Clostridium sp. MD294 TaxID=97138 RepID=UPI0002CB0759|nr:TPM domain-containing protein [Clostridium sp. MD294]NDO45410.1 TPM domain-containing protein [Clostridium sp. MD294]USF30945.1 hypothetical protein C820_002389 [Clostridium sp. MD294]
MKNKSHTLFCIRFFYIVFIIFIGFVTSIHTIFAAANMPRLVDDAELLSDAEKTQLLYKLDEISERQQTDIVVVTVPSLRGVSSVKYADDFYDYYDYGFGDEKDGILFIISMEERDWYISTTGYAITAVTDAGMKYMSEQFLNDLSEGNYAEAFTIFADLCDDFITQAKAGKPYDVDNMPKEPFWFIGNFLICFGIGFIISLIVTGIMKSKLKTIRPQSAADIYVKNGSMNITKNSDLFLYSHIDRRKKPENNSSGSHSGGSNTHTSSSGRTHGGSGGKF